MYASGHSTYAKINQLNTGGDPNPDLESLWPTSDGPVSLPVNTSPYWTVLSGLMTNPPMPPYALHPALSRADASTHYHEGSASGLCSSQLPCSRDPANHFDQSAYPLPSSSTPFVEGMGLWPHPEPQTHGLGLVCLAYEPSLSMGGAGSGIPSTADMTSTSSSGTPIRDASSDMEIRPLSVTRPTIGSERQRKVSNGRRLLEARYTCNVDGCDGTFTRRHNLKSEKSGPFMSALGE